jgi:hypothetical protein
MQLKRGDEQICIYRNQPPIFILIKNEKMGHQSTQPEWPCLASKREERLFGPKKMPSLKSIALLGSRRAVVI